MGGGLEITLNANLVNAYLDFGPAMEQMIAGIGPMSSTVPFLYVYSISSFALVRGKYSQVFTSDASTSESIRMLVSP